MGKTLRKCCHGQNRFGAFNLKYLITDLGIEKQRKQTLNAWEKHISSCFPRLSFITDASPPPRLLVSSMYYHRLHSVSLVRQQAVQEVGMNVYWSLSASPCFPLFFPPALSFVLVSSVLLLWHGLSTGQSPF